MPVALNKKDLEPQNGGDYRIRVWAYAPARGVDDEGSVIRDPSGVGTLPGGTEPSAEKLWVDRCSIYTFGLQGRENMAAEVTESYFTVETRWSPGKQYRAGMMIYFPGTAELFTVQAAQLFQDKFKKVLLTCRRVA